jgi:hypothetical protein
MLRSGVLVHLRLCEIGDHATLRKTGIKPRRTTLTMQSRDEGSAEHAARGDAGKGPAQSGRWP